MAQFLVVRHHRAARLDFTFLAGGDFGRLVRAAADFERWIGDDFFGVRFAEAIGEIFAESHFTLGFIEFSVAADA